MTLPPIGPALFGMGALVGFVLLLIWVIWRESPPADDYPHEIGDGS